MRLPKSIQKSFYWTIILSMVMSMSLPIGLVRARDDQEEISPKSLNNLQEAQKDNPISFNFSDEKAELNQEKASYEDFESKVKKGEVITAKDIKAKELPYRKIEQKQAVKPVEEKQISIEKKETGSTLTQNKAYFDHLISQLSLSQPKSLDEVKNRGWKEISYGKIKPIEDLVKAVPNELLSSTEKTTTNMYDPGEREELKQKRSLPTLSLQSEYLIFFAKQNSSNPATQNLKISNRGEGTLNYTLSENISWLTLDSTSGSVTTETDIVNVFVNISGLTTANSPYVGEILVNNTSNPEDSEVVKVRLIINQNDAFIGSFSYDANNNLKTKIDSNNNVVEYGYDSLNRLTKIIYPDGGEVSFTYDENGNRTSMTDQSGTTNYYYDQFDRLYAVQYPGINPIIYEYDKADRIIKITYPDQQEVHYAYDSDDRLITVIDQTGTTNYLYNAATGYLDSVTLANGTKITYGYDIDGRLIDVINKKANGDLISAYHYTLDANGMRTQVIEEKPSGSKTTSYTYDNLNRLQIVAYPGGRTVTYTYDELGNRLSMNDSVNGATTYVYDNDNRLVELSGPDGKEVFLYDNNGNLVKRANKNKTIEYVYDHENRLVGYNDGENEVSFEYDGAGNRVAKTVNGERTNYINDLNTNFVQPLIEANASWGVEKTYTYGLDRLNQTTGTGTSSFYYYDIPGKSVMGLTDFNGAVVGDYEYNDFGSVFSGSSDVDNVFKYNGEILDKEIGLIFLRARYYDPSIGRFISRDPVSGLINSPQSLSPYIFAENNPINYTDPEGEFLDILIDAISIGYDIYEIATEGATTENLVALGLDVGCALLPFAAGGGAAYKAYKVGKEYSTVSNKLGNIGETYLKYSDNLVKNTQEVNGVIPDFVKGDIFIESKNVSRITSDNMQQISKMADIKPTIVKTRTTTKISPEIDKVFKEKGVIVDPVFKGNTFTKGSRPLFGPGWAGTGLAAGNSLAGDLMNNGDPGGVDLNLTATLMLNIDDIAGATYDEKTGQLVLFGQENTSMPEMDLDDLAVGVQSVFRGSDPGVSIDPPIENGNFTVRYEGETEWTEFGWVMFEADRVMKILGLGKDNITGEPISSNVPGWQSLGDRYLATGECGSGETKNVRFWFTPKEVKLVKSADGQSMVFDSVAMQVLTETTYQGGAESDPVAQAFADHFTAHYDEFAEEWPVLKDLERLSKITAIVKWIRDNDIPLDASFLENFEVEFYSTPETTPATTVVQDNGQCTITLEGGVTYRMPNEYLADDPIEPVTDELREAALSTRPEETEFIWDFAAPAGGKAQSRGLVKAGEELTAIAHSFTRSRKDGNINLAQTDLTMPAQGDFSLELTRYYNSFNEKSGELGFGWSILPFQIRFPYYKRVFTFAPDNREIALYEKIWVRENINGREDLYSLLGIDENNLPLYQREGSSELLRENREGGFSLSKKDDSMMVFNSDGTLQSLTDANGNQLNYSYDNGRLVSVAHPSGRQISVSYNAQNKISQIAGLDKTVSYVYEADGDLSVVAYHPSEEDITYNYDEEHRLTSAIDNRGNVIFNYQYDVYGRALGQTFRNEADYNYDFDLNEQRTVITDPNNQATENYFDDNYRLTESVDPLGNKVALSYQGGYGPGSIIDNYGHITDYEYDVHGNLRAVINDQGERMDLYYDNSDNLIAARDFADQSTAFGYDGKGNLTIIYHYAFIDEDGTIYVNPDYVSNLQYDAKGNLTGVIDPEGINRDFAYDANGLPDNFGLNNGPDVEFNYDGNSKLTSINQGDTRVNFTYDNADNIEAISTHSGSISYDYDDNNNLAGITDAENNHTAYNYDHKNNLTSVVDAESKTTSYTYDIVNNLTGVRLPNNKSLNYHYDELGRLIGVERNLGPVKPDIAVLPASIDFGAVAVGDSSQKELSIYNVGTADLVVSSISSNNNSFTVNFTSPITIPAQKNHSLIVTFSPQSVGNVSGQLTVNSNDPDEPAVNVGASGIGKNIISGLLAAAAETGIELSWNPYNDIEGDFARYNIYRETEYFNSVLGLTALDSSITDINNVSFLDETAEPGTVYYYAITAVLTNDFEDKDVTPAGPVSYYSNFDVLGEALDIANDGNHEYKPDIVYNSTNNEYFMVYEYDYYGDGSDFDIMGQRISIDGQKIGEPIYIFATGYHEKNPKIAYNSATNNYLAVFEHDYYGDGSAYFLLAQLVSAAGTLLNQPFFIGPYAYQEHNPTIVYNSQNHEYLVAYECDLYGTGQYFIFWRRVNDTGPLGGPTGRFYSTDRNPSLAYNSQNNNYLLVWQYYNVWETPNNYALIFLLLNNQGSILADDYGVNYHYRDDVEPAVTYNSQENEYLLAWQYDYSGNGSDFDVQALALSTADASWLSGVLDISSQANHHEKNPDVIYNSLSNEYLVSYEYDYSGNGADYDIRARRINHNWELTGKTISLANRSLKHELKPTLAFNHNDGKVMAAYEYDANGNGGNWDIYGRLAGAENPSLYLNPQSLDFGAEDNELPLYLSNAGDGTLDWYAIPSEPWISIDPEWGSLTGSRILDVSIDRSQLLSGEYGGEIWFYSDGGNQSVPVYASSANNPPNLPSGPTPAVGAENQAGLGGGLRIPLGWQANDPDAGDILSYDVYLSSNQTLVENLDSSVKIANLSEKSYTTAVLNFNTWYYWRVVVHDGQGAEAIGPVWRFKTIPLGAPVIISYQPDPTNNQRPTLEWQGVNGADHYHLQIADSAGFDHVLVDADNLITTSYSPANNLPEAVIYWRVSSVDSQGQESQFSSADSFIIDITPPTTPILEVFAPDPTNNQKPTLTWQSAAGAVYYHLQIAGDSAFANLLVNEWLSLTSFTPENNLPEGKIYWRVSAKDAAGNESVFTSADDFIIDATPFSAPILMPYEPDPTVERRPQLAWQEVSGAVSYHIQIDDSLDLSAPLISEIVESTSFTPVSDLPISRIYWRVASRDAIGNESAYSEIDNFLITVNGAPTLDIVEPNGVNDFADENFVIRWTDDDPYDSALISLYYDTDNQGEDGILIIDNISEDDEADQYLWDTSAVSEGEYYVYGIIDDGVNDPVVVYSNGPVSVARFTLYEDAEDQTILGWLVYDTIPAGAVVSNVYDNEKQTQVIQFTGAGWDNAYRLYKENNTPWNNTTQRIIQWSQKYGERFTIYIEVETTGGHKYLDYSAVNENYLGSEGPNYAHHGLGASAKNNTWQTFTRDLTTDFHDVYPNLNITSVNGFFIRGNGKVDEIKLRELPPQSLDSDNDGLSDREEITIYHTHPYKADTDSDGLNDGEEKTYWDNHANSSWDADVDGDGLLNLLDPDSDNDNYSDGMEANQNTDPADPESYTSLTVYEDAEDSAIAGWDIYDNIPAGAVVSNAYDEIRQSRVIAFTGSGWDNGYRLRNADGSNWNNQNQFVIQWSMKYNGNYSVYVGVNTTKGYRYISYTPSTTDLLYVNNTNVIEHGLGPTSRNNTWQTFTRDLTTDFKDAEPNHSIISIDSFWIRGNGRVDDIILRELPPEDLDSDSDGLSDLAELTIHQTHPYRQDSDSDNHADGYEVAMETDPNNPESYPDFTLYEDAEDQTTLGWLVYDTIPAGAVVSNVYDNEKQTRVILFTGSGWDNAYRLYKENNTAWNNTTQRVIQWSMKYGERFTVYIEVETTGGHKYLDYSPVNENYLGSEGPNYVHHGLGASAKNNTWQTFTRDLTADLHDVYPTLNITAVNGFFIRGNGRVDEIKLMADL